MILQGDARALPLSDQSIDCVVTSPPYWGLRDYGTPGQLGLEETPEDYVANMVSVFREVWRVLKDDGTLWLNLGDSYNSRPGGPQGASGDRADRTFTAEARKWRNGAGRADGVVDERGQRNRDGVPPVPGLKPKDLVGIPWRVAFALQADGWYLRSDIIWAKPNPMPESVTDRPTKAHEYIFLLAKRERYYYDAESIKEEAGPFHAGGRNNGLDNPHTPDPKKKQDALGKATYTGFNARWIAAPTEKRNRRTVWEIATQPYPKAHFATFPEALVEPCVLAGCPKGGRVLDPFAGSGTVGAVCHRLGREFVGTELSAEYCALAFARTAQMGLI